MPDHQEYKYDIDLVDTMGGVCPKCGKTVNKIVQDLPTRWDGSSDFCDCSSPTLVVGDETNQRISGLILNDAGVPKGVRKAGEIVARHYEIIELLGSGGMSVVFKARHLLLNKMVAIKMLLPDVQHTHKMVLRLRQEAKAISCIQHDNIVQVREFGINDEGLPYLVMDYIEGRSLASVLAQRGKMSADDALSMSLQIAAGLMRAHAAGVVHRDIKPANLILTDDGVRKDVVKIVDFGIAKLEEENASGHITQTGEIFGSPFYMSPEQCVGKAVDHRSDIYSAGCVLYECLSGNPPFVSDSRITVMMMHIQDDPEIKESVFGTPLKIVLQKCLAKDPRDRYQSAEHLQADLLKILHGGVPEKPITPIGKRLKVRQWAPLLVAAIVTVGAVLSLQYWAQSHAPPKDVVRLPTPEEARKMNFYSGTPDDFAPGKEPPHVARPLGSATAGDAYAEADGIDHSTMVYFNRGEYDKAIPLLEFAAQTYKEGGRHYNNDPDIETAYLAGTHLHLGQCYQMTSQWEKAKKNYRECFRLYNKVKIKPALYEDAVSGYADVIEQSGSIEEADRILDEYRSTGKVSVSE